jgi:hypothetical protein
METQLARPQARAVGKVITAFLLAGLSEFELHLINTASEKNLKKAIKRMCKMEINVSELMEGLVFTDRKKEAFNQFENRSKGIKFFTSDIDFELFPPKMYEIPQSMQESEVMSNAGKDDTIMVLSYFWKLIYLFVLQPNLGEIVFHQRLDHNKTYRFYVGSIKLPQTMFSVCLRFRESLFILDVEIYDPNVQITRSNEIVIYPGH